MSRKVALLIGVSEYGEGIPSLSAPLNDVAAMKRVLENPNMGGFDEIETCINPDVAAMQTVVQQIFTNCRKDDLVLLFFSGHGITDDNNRLYFATKGISKDYYKATSVPASFVQDVSLESYAKRQAIVLDCCYSGAFAEGWQTKSAGINLQQELGAEGRAVLTSSTATQTSFQQEDKDIANCEQEILASEVKYWKIKNNLKRILNMLGKTDKSVVNESRVSKVEKEAEAQINESSSKVKKEVEWGEKSIEEYNSVEREELIRIGKELERKSNEEIREQIRKKTEHLTIEAMLEAKPQQG